VIASGREWEGNNCYVIYSARATIANYRHRQSPRQTMLPCGRAPSNVNSLIEFDIKTMNPRHPKGDVPLPFPLATVASSLSLFCWSFFAFCALFFK
jgi:hypothetical protein